MFDNVQKFKEHIIEMYIKRELYNKLLEVCDGHSEYTEYGFTLL